MLNWESLTPAFLLLFQAYLHSMCIIHRDLNSHNCLIKLVSYIHLFPQHAAPLLGIFLPWFSPHYVPSFVRVELISERLCAPSRGASF